MDPIEKIMRMAPEGTIWLCTACGKTAEDTYGIEGKHSHGWDESCMLNCELVDKLTMKPITEDRARKLIRKQLGSDN